jgi:hypothetical protein
MMLIVGGGVLLILALLSLAETHGGDWRSK